MADYTITLTDEEVKAFSTVTHDVDTWITNRAQERARIAGDDIIEALIHHCNINGIDLESGREAQIQQGIDLGIAFVRTEPVALEE